MENTKFKQAFAVFLVVSIMVVFVVYMLAPMSREQRQDFNDIKSNLLIFMALIIGYFYGSSQGSANKQEQIKDLQNAGTQSIKIENADAVNQVGTASKEETEEEKKKREEDEIAKKESENPVQL